MRSSAIVRKSTVSRTGTSQAALRTSVGIALTSVATAVTTKLARKGGAG